MKITHTPGPWHVVHHRPNLFKVETNRVVICDTFGGLSDETLANALLIAAAPDLLAVLQQIVEDTNEFLDVSSDADTFADRMRANCEDAERAIAKAGGVK